jgi:hypothetical protein
MNKTTNTAAVEMNAMQAAMAKAQAGLKSAQKGGKIAKDVDINEVIAKAVKKTMDEVAKTTGHKMSEQQISSIIAVMMGNEPKKENTVKKTTATKKTVAPAAETAPIAEEVTTETKKPAEKKVMRLKVEDEVKAKASKAEAARQKVKTAKTREDRIEAAEKYAAKLAKIPGVKVVFNAEDVEMSKKILKAEKKAEGKKSKKADKPITEKAPVELVAAKASAKKDSAATLGWFLNRSKK